MSSPGRNQTIVDLPIVLFDGRCNLCNGAVRFILANERAAVLRFASLDSRLGEELIRRAFGAERASELLRGRAGDGDAESVVLIDGASGWTHSEAALRVAGYLRAPYRWLRAARVVPRPLRDALYRFVARHRYRWFGRTATCGVPTPELRERFLA